LAEAEATEAALAAAQEQLAEAEATEAALLLQLERARLQL
jgi:hypothetical protein